MSAQARFPFSAVVGQGEARLALLLAAVDPGIGGVLLRGDKGAAKSTLARGLAGMLPGGAPFVELPLGATEATVVGTIDTSAGVSATDGAAAFRPGLLAAANGGVLYVDEVNLLPDPVVDVLLDVAASGVNRVGRDGVSHSHPARFVLVGSMNPEEGELRPQLLDRFGLSVEIKAPTDPQLRAEIVRRRLTHDAGGRVGGGEGDIVLRARLAASMPADLPDTVVDFACRLAVGVGAEGLRADLVLCRAAAAFAGWEGREVATSADVERVAAFALGHRRRRRPFDPPVLGDNELERALGSARQSFADAYNQLAPPAASLGAGPAASGAAPTVDSAGGADVQGAVDAPAPGEAGGAAPFSAAAGGEDGNGNGNGSGEGDSDEARAAGSDDLTDTGDRGTSPDLGDRPDTGAVTAAAGSDALTDTGDRGMSPGVGGDASGEVPAVGEATGDSGPGGDAGPGTSPWANLVLGSPGESGAPDGLDGPGAGPWARGFPGAEPTTDGTTTEGLTDGTTDLTPPPGGGARADGSPPVSPWSELVPAPTHDADQGETHEPPPANPAGHGPWGPPAGTTGTDPGRSEGSSDTGGTPAAGNAGSAAGTDTSASGAGHTDSGASNAGTTDGTTDGTTGPGGAGHTDTSASGAGHTDSGASNAGTTDGTTGPGGAGSAAGTGTSSTETPGGSAGPGGADAPSATWQSLTASSFGSGAGAAAPGNDPGSDGYPGGASGQGRLGRTGTSPDERAAVLRQLAMRPRTEGGIALADAVATTMPARPIDLDEPDDVDTAVAVADDTGDAPITPAGPERSGRTTGRTVGRTVVIAVDASGSVGTHRRVEAATGAVLGLLSDAYLRRDRISLVTFRGDAAEVVLPPTASVELARTRLAELPTGGVTPLGEGISAGLSLARRAQADGWPPLLVLITDGRATGNQNARERADAAAAEVAADGVEVVVIDADDTQGGAGLADELATATAGRCIRPAELTAAAVETVVRDALR